MPSKKTGGTGKLKVHRKAYTNKKGVKVKATTFEIKDRGNKGRGPKVIPKLEAGDLTQYGYHADKETEVRHKALAEAVREFGPTSVALKLNALYVLNKNTHPDTAETYTEDREWIDSTYKV
ncbi:MAG TPA: hypothetical protein VMS77_09820 [Conexivisphaerales archaeon]|nr:hypothetical protein [Conexivisphaerales archaeon]